MAENNFLDENTLMDSDQNLDKSIQKMLHLLKNYESLAMNIQNEAKKFNEENKKLRQDLATIIEENQRLRGQYDDDLLGKFKSDYIDVADKIFINLKNQLTLCYQEKEMYEKLWKKTASVLERETPANSIEKIITDHSLEVKKLKYDLTGARSECKKQADINASLQKSMKMIMQKLEVIQKENKDLNAENNELYEKLKELESEKDETQKLLEESNDLNKEQVKKSRESLKKMQQAIEVAEGAMKEAEKHVREKKHIEDEYNHLAETIGSVIEQASERVDSEMENLKRQHNDEMEKSKFEIERLGHMLALEKEKTISAMHQASALEEKLQSIDKTNTFLSQDLDNAFKKIDEANEQHAKLIKVIESEKESSKLCQYEVKKLRSIIENNHKVKLKWKSVILDITQQLEERVKNLLIENNELKSRRTI